MDRGYPFVIFFGFVKMLKLSNWLILPVENT